MSKKNIIVLAVTFLAVAGFYFYLYRDSFRKENIQISHTIRPKARALTHPAANASEDDPINIITFRLGHDYRLTCIKVIPVPELETNQYAHPVWELLSDSNSVPLQAFTYGKGIRGMHPTVKGAQPSALALNTPYRLFVEAGSIKGQHDFTVTEENRLAQ
jgi:hypothetical protein